MNVIEQLLGTRVKTSEHLSKGVIDGVGRVHKMKVAETLEKHLRANLSISPIAQILTRGVDEDRFPKLDYWWKSGEIENRHHCRCGKNDEMVGVTFTINRHSAKTIPLFDGREIRDCPMISTPICRIEVEAIDREEMVVRLRMVGGKSENMPGWAGVIAGSRDFSQIAPAVVGCIEEYVIRSK